MLQYSMGAASCRLLIERVHVTSRATAREGTPFVKPEKLSWSTRLTGLPAPWNRPTLTLMGSGLIALIAIAISQWHTTHTLIVGMLIALVWMALGLTDTIRALHQELRKR